MYMYVHVCMCVCGACGWLVFVSDNFFPSGLKLSIGIFLNWNLWKRSMSYFAFPTPSQKAPPLEHYESVHIFEKYGEKAFLERRNFSLYICTMYCDLWNAIQTIYNTVHTEIQFDLSFSNWCKYWKRKHITCTCGTKEDSILHRPKPRPPPPGSLCPKYIYIYIYIYIYMWRFVCFCFICLLSCCLCFV